MTTGPDELQGLRIALRQISESPRQLRFLTDAAWWIRACQSAGQDGVELLEPFALSLEGHSLGRRLLFRGRLEGRVALACSRCAESYPLALSERVELLLEPASDPGALECSIELDQDEAGVGRYAGDELDFEPVVSEVLWLAWPMQPLCREDCRGLCPGCGRNRNLETCGCATGERQRPFAGLAEKLALRAGSEGSRGSEKVEGAPASQETEEPDEPEEDGKG